MKRIFTKASNHTSFDSRAIRRGERVAMVLNHRMRNVEDKVDVFLDHAEEHEQLLQQTKEGIHSLEDEIGTGMVEDIHAAVHNIDYNVYQVPPQVSHNIKRLLDSRISALGKRVEAPLGDIQSNVDEIRDFLSSPLNSPVSRVGESHAVRFANDDMLKAPHPSTLRSIKHNTSVSNPLEEMFGKSDSNQNSNSNMSNSHESEREKNKKKKEKKENSDGDRVRDANGRW